MRITTKTSRHSGTALLYAVAAVFFAGTLAASCSKEEVKVPVPDSQTTVVRARIAGYSGDGQILEGETAVRSLQACIFEGGRMTRIYDGISGSGSSFDIQIDRHSGNLYLLANTSGLVDLGALQSGNISEDEWLRHTVGSGTGTPAHFYTGKVVLDDRANVHPVTLTRGVARFDLQIRTAGDASVNSITLKNSAGSAFLFPVPEENSPADVSREDVTVDFDVPAETDIPGVLYVYEQDADGLEITVEAVIDGRPVTLAKTLDDNIERNTIYTITVRKDVIDVSLEISFEEWQPGGDFDMVPGLDSRLSVDTGRSLLPDNVSVSEDGTLLLPHLHTEFVLAIDSPDELELLPVEGHMFSVEHAGDSDGNPHYDNIFRITKGLYAPGVPGEETVLQFRRKGLQHIYPEDRIAVRLSPNPTSIEGGMDFSSDSYTHDFGKYVDNELGVFTLPEGKEIFAEFPDAEDPWIRVSPLADGSRSFRVTGGWRPNDPSADGRKQSATIVIRNTDGSDREEYTVARRNYGLPVVNLHGVWWCKYNAMGNSRSFEDQILSSEDPAAAAGKTLFEYLTDCSPEEYAGLWGWAYQGDSGKGMRVVESDGVPVMDAFNPDNSVHINMLAADALSPDGYELPSMEEFNRIFDATDYIWMMWNGSHTLKTPWEGHTKLDRVQKRKNGVEVGNLVIDDLIYIAMSSPDFPGNEPVVWYGPGTQWNTSEGIGHYGHHNNMLFGVYSPAGEGWYMGGSMAGLYMTKNGAGPKDTRILRFRKSDVEYIY